MGLQDRTTTNYQDNLINIIDGYIEGKTQIPADNTCWIHGEGCQTIKLDYEFPVLCRINNDSIKAMESCINDIHAHMVSKKEDVSIKTEVEFEILLQNKLLFTAMCAFINKGIEHGVGTSFFCAEFERLYWTTYESIMIDLRSVFASHIQEAGHIHLSIIADEMDKMRAIKGEQMVEGGRLCDRIGPTEEDLRLKQMAIVWNESTLSLQEKTDKYIQLGKSLSGLRNIVANDVFGCNYKMGEMLKQYAKTSKKAKSQILKSIQEVVSCEIKDKNSKMPVQCNGGKTHYNEGMNDSSKSLFRLLISQISELNIIMAIKDEKAVDIDILINAFVGIVSKMTEGLCLHVINHNLKISMMLGVTDTVYFKELQHFITLLDEVITRRTGVSIKPAYDSINQLKEPKPLAVDGFLLQQIRPDTR